MITYDIINGQLKESETGHLVEFSDVCEILRGCITIFEASKLREDYRDFQFENDFQRKIEQMIDR